MQLKTSTSRLSSIQFYMSCNSDIKRSEILVAANIAIYVNKTHNISSLTLFVMLLVIVVKYSFIFVLNGDNCKHVSSVHSLDR